MQRNNPPHIKSPFKSQKRRKHRNRKKPKAGSAGQEKFSQLYAPASSTSNMTAATNLNIWRKTYENLIKWQTQYQIQYWRNTTNNLRHENEELRKRLEAVTTIKSNVKTIESSNTEYHETDSDTDDDEDCSIDEEYLEFMMKTRRHQESVESKKLLSDCD